MPIYRYRCGSCGGHEEHLQKVSDPAVEHCAKCGGPLAKQMTAAAFHLKGGGWYKDLYASAGKSSDASSPAAPSSDAGSSTPSTSDSSTAAPSTPSTPAPSTPAPTTPSSTPSPSGKASSAA
jgi:putative FmdB family regulatory protein